MVCMVKGCKSRRTRKDYTDEFITFYRFPKDESTITEWKRRFSRPDWTPKIHIASYSCAWRWRGVLLKRRPGTQLRSCRLPSKKSTSAILIGAAAAILLITGLCCLLIRVKVEGTPGATVCNNITVYDYHNVSSLEYSQCVDEDEIPCHNRTDDCSCTVDMNLPESINGEVVVGYYLDTFDYLKINQSRDDIQISGILSSDVSHSCKPYVYNTATGNPIAPCGALANAMFTDNIEDVYDTNDGKVKTVPRITYGLLRKEEKEGFHNPENENLTVAFQNFSKPIAWKKNVWELDLNLTENNGFQNEAFIVWMRNDSKIKPLWRLNRTGDYENGLKSGKYTFKINYAYPYSMYDGPRHLILYEELTEQERKCRNTTGTPESDRALNGGFGITCIVFFFILLLVSIVILRKGKVEKPVEEAITDTTGDRPTFKPPEPPAQVNVDGNSESRLLDKAASAQLHKPEQKHLNTLLEDDGE